MKIEKQKLHNALEIVRPGLATKEQITQTTSFAFTEGKVVTFNDLISLSHPIENLDIRGAVEASELYNILTKLNDGEININVSGNEVILKTGKMKAGFTLQSEIQLPLNETIEKKTWEEIPDNFLKFLKFAMGACSSDMSNPTLTCVHVNESGLIEGSDSYKITRCVLNKNMPVPSFLLPANSVKEVLKIRPDKIAKSDRWIHFSNPEGTVLSCRIYYESTYRDLSGFLDVKGAQIEFPKMTDKILDRAWVFAKRDNQLEEKIQINIENKRMIVSSWSNTGTFSEKIFINYEGNPIEFLISPYLLVDILKETNKCILNENAIKFEGEGWQYVSVLQSKE